MSRTIEIYSADYCGYCQRAKKLLESLDLKYNEHNLEDEGVLEDFRTLGEDLNIHTIPQIFINGTHVGGFDELNQLVQSGKLWNL
jgi:glutaredoxin 3